MANLAFSPRYAAPEVVAAFEAKQPQVKVEPSMDMWALGVMAFELLTDAPAFSREVTQDVRSPAKSCMLLVVTRACGGLCMQPMSACARPLQATTLYFCSVRVAT